MPYSKSDKVEFAGRQYIVAKVDGDIVYIRPARVSRYERRVSRQVTVAELTPFDPAAVEAKKEAAKAQRSTCQICGRDIMANKHGKIAHHGYERPGYGWQTHSCMGAQEQRYEDSRDLIPSVIEMLERMKADEAKRIEVLTARTVGVARTVRKAGGFRGYKEDRVEVNSVMVPVTDENRLAHVGDEDYEYLRKSAIARAEQMIERLQHDSDYMQDRYDKWFKGRSFRDM
jgi:hypothetical protein